VLLRFKPDFDWFFIEKYLIAQLNNLFQIK